MTSQTTSSSDASTILTVGELTLKDVTSSASVIDSYTIGSASKDSRQSYDSDSWETTTDTPKRGFKKSSERTETIRTSESNSDADDDGGRGGPRKKHGGGNAISGTEGYSYYTADWESNQSYNTDSDWEESLISQARSSRRHFIQAKLKLLKTPQHKPMIQTPQETVTPYPESNDRNTFCQNAIRAIEKKTALNYDVSTKPRMKGTYQSSRNSSHADSNVLTNREIVNRLKIENLLSMMKKAASSDVSDGTDSCKHCHELQESSTRRDFIRQRTSRLENELTERRVDWVLNTQDPLTAVGDLVQSLPKPSDDPKEIWDRLMNQGDNVMTDVVSTKAQ